MILTPISKVSWILKLILGIASIAEDIHCLNWTLDFTCSTCTCRYILKGTFSLKKKKNCIKGKM